MDGNHTLNIIIKVTDKATAPVKKVRNQMKAMTKDVKAVSKTFGNFTRAIQNTLLGVGLSFLFTGMAIKRFFEGILRSLTSSFLTVMGETSAQAQQVGRLQASWEFLKFKIMSALVASGLWDKVINWIQTIIDRTTQWVKDHPEATANLIKWVAILAVAGTLMMVLGQLLLGLLGFLSLIVGVWKLINFTMSLGVGIIKGLVFLVSGGAAGSFVWALLLVLGIALMLKAKFGSWGNVFKELGNTIVRVMLLPLQGILSIVINLIDALGAVSKAVGKDNWANGLSKAASKLEDLRTGIDDALTWELDKSAMPENTGEGLLKMLLPSGIEGLLGLSGNQQTAETPPTTNYNGDINLDLGGLGMAVTDLKDLIRSVVEGTMSEMNKATGSPQTG